MKKIATITTSLIETLVNNVYQIAHNNPSGFTINLNSLQLIKSGFVSAYKETQNSFGISGLKAAITFALLIGSNTVGGWYNAANGMYYFDASKVFENQFEAANFGIENEQIAIFDLNDTKEIQLI